MTNPNEFETCSVLGDVLATVLALYMHDKDQPLPNQEEVLICTPETTTEEVTWIATLTVSCSKMTQDQLVLFDVYFLTILSCL